jgi:hypothetical protein
LILDDFYNYDIEDLEDKVTLTSWNIYNFQNETQDNLSEQQRKDLTHISQKILDIFSKITRCGAPIFFGSVAIIGLLNDSITLPDNLQKLLKNYAKTVTQQAELETPCLPPSNDNENIPNLP